MNRYDDAKYDEDGADLLQDRLLADKSENHIHHTGTSSFIDRIDTMPGEIPRSVTSSDLRSHQFDDLENNTDHLTLYNQELIPSQQQQQPGRSDRTGVRFGQIARYYHPPAVLPPHVAMAMGHVPSQHEQRLHVKPQNQHVEPHHHQHQHEHLRRHHHQQTLKSDQQELPTKTTTTQTKHVIPPQPQQQQEQLPNVYNWYMNPSNLQSISDKQSHDPVPLFSIAKQPYNRSVETFVSEGPRASDTAINKPSSPRNRSNSVSKQEVFPTQYAKPIAVYQAIDRLDDNIDKVKDDLNRGLDTASRKIESTKRELIDSIETTTTDLSKKIDSNLQQLSHTVDEFKSSFRDNVENQNNIIDRTASKISNAIDDVKSEVNNSIRDSQNIPRNSIGTSIQQQLSAPITSTQIQRNIDHVVHDIKQTADDLGTAASNLISPNNQLTGATNKARRDLTNVVDDVKTTAESLSSSVSNLIGKMEPTPIDKAIDATINAIDSTEEAINTTLDALDNIKQDTMNKIHDVGQQVEHAFPATATITPPPPPSQSFTQPRSRFDEYHSPEYHSVLDNFTTTSPFPQILSPQPHRLPRQAPFAVDTNHIDFSSMFPTSNVASFINHHDGQIYHVLHPSPISPYLPPPQCLDFLTETDSSCLYLPSAFSRNNSYRYLNERGTVPLHNSDDFTYHLNFTTHGLDDLQNAQQQLLRFHRIDSSQQQPNNINIILAPQYRSMADGQSKTRPGFTRRLWDSLNLPSFVLPNPSNLFITSPDGGDVYLPIYSPDAYTRVPGHPHEVLSTENVELYHNMELALNRTNTMVELRPEQYESMHAAALNQISATDLVFPAPFQMEDVVVAHQSLSPTELKLYQTVIPLPDRTGRTGGSNSNGTVTVTNFATGIPSPSALDHIQRHAPHPTNPVYFTNDIENNNPTSQPFQRLPQSTRPGFESPFPRAATTDQYITNQSSLPQYLHPSQPTTQNQAFKPESTRDALMEQYNRLVAQYGRPETITNNPILLQQFDTLQTQIDLLEAPSQQSTNGHRLHHNAPGFNTSRNQAWNDLSSDPLSHEMRRFERNNNVLLDHGAQIPLTTPYQVQSTLYPSTSLPDVKVDYGTNNRNFSQTQDRMRETRPSFYESRYDHINNNNTVDVNKITTSPAISPQNQSFAATSAKFKDDFQHKYKHNVNSIGSMLKRAAYKVNWFLSPVDRLTLGYTDPARTSLNINRMMADPSRWEKIERRLLDKQVSLEQLNQKLDVQMRESEWANGSRLNRPPINNAKNADRINSTSRNYDLKRLSTWEKFLFYNQSNTIVQNIAQLMPLGAQDILLRKEDELGEQFKYENQQSAARRRKLGTSASSSPWWPYRGKLDDINYTLFGNDKSNHLGYQKHLSQLNDTNPMIDPQQHRLGQSSSPQYSINLPPTTHHNMTIDPNNKNHIQDSVKHKNEIETIKTKVDSQITHSLDSPHLVSNSALPNSTATSTTQFYNKYQHPYSLSAQHFNDKGAAISSQYQIDRALVDNNQKAWDQYELDRGQRTTADGKPTSNGHQLPFMKQDPLHEPTIASVGGTIDYDLINYRSQRAQYDLANLNRGNNSFNNPSLTATGANGGNNYGYRPADYERLQQRYDDNRRQASPEPVAQLLFNQFNLHQQLMARNNHLVTKIPDIPFQHDRKFLPTRVQDEVAVVDTFTHPNAQTQIPYVNPPSYFDNDSVSPW